MFHSHHSMSSLMLSKIFFSGNKFFPDRPATLTEANWTFDELKCACARLKVNKACDESGLAAELPQHGRDEFSVELFRLSNGILQHGSAPQGLKKTLFTVVPKKTRAKFVTDSCLIDSKLGTVVGSFASTKIFQIS